MSKKRANRNNKKVLKALKQKRSTYNIGGYRQRFNEFEPLLPSKIPSNKLEAVKQAPSGQFGVEAAVASPAQASQTQTPSAGANLIQQNFGEPFVPSAEMQQELQKLQQAQAAALQGQPPQAQGKSSEKELGIVSNQQPQQISAAQREQVQKVQAEAQKVSNSPEYQRLLKEYENTKGDPKIREQLESMVQPFVDQQEAIMSQQTPFAQAQSAGLAQQAATSPATTTDTGNTQMGRMTNQNSGSGFYRPDPSEAPVDEEYDPTKDTTTGGGTTGGGTSTPDPVVDTTERQRRIAETATRVEDAAAGTGTVPKADVVKTGQGFDYQKMDDTLANMKAFKDGTAKATFNPQTGMYTLEASGTTTEQTPQQMAALAGVSLDDFMGIDPSLQTSKDDIEEISARSATTAPDDITAQGISTTTAGVTKADLKKGFSLSSFNDDIRQGVSKKFGTSVQAVKNKNGTFSLVRKDGSVAQTYPNSASMARDIGLNANTYMQKGAIDAAQVTAAKAGDLSATTAAQGSDPDKASVTEISSLTDKAVAATAPTDEELKKLEAGTTTFAERDEDYAAAATDGTASSVDMPKVPLLDAEGNAVRNADGTVVMVDASPEVATREAKQISDEDASTLLERVSDSQITLEDTVDINTGEVIKGIPSFDRQQVQQKDSEGNPVFDDQGNPVMITRGRTAQVGEAASRVKTELGDAPSADLQGREAITGTAAQGDASQIGGIPTAAAASMQAVTGTERTAAAADMMAIVADLPDEITAAISEDPATVQAQIDTGADPQVTAAVAALPQEALVSVQMEQLLAGMEDGKTPAWARPAVAAIEQNLAQRGLEASTVGRDALFNAIIQSALPIANSNAQALQQRAAQNLSNEQQANLATSQNQMQVRMANLANQQTAASQTAQMSQQIKVQQGQFRQEARITSEQQEQQTALANFQAAQQQASQESSQRQQAALANLDAGTRSDLANLQALNAAESQNLTAEQQSRLASYNAQVNRTMRQAELKQDMEKANLSAEMQMKLANLTEENVASRDTMTAENQEELANLNVLVDFKKTNATLGQQMDLANLNAEQQMNLANLAERAATDAANFTADERRELQRLTTYTSMMSQNAELRQRAELARLSAAEKVELANLAAQNQADSESMTAQNVASLQKYEKKMQAAQVNAQLANQMGLANLSNEQEAAMFNAQTEANMDITKFNADQQVELANAKFMQTMSMQNLSNQQQAAMQNATAMAALDLATVDQRTKLAVTNAQNFLQMDLANLNNRQQATVLDQQMKQQRLLSDQAATNAANQFNATSENQTNQFVASMEANMSQFNASQANALSQFNASEANRASALEAENALKADSINAELGAKVAMFDQELQFRTDSWNAANAQAVEQSNVEWRRKSNTLDTAAQNAANQQSASFAFNMSQTAQAQLWQELRDQATFDQQSSESGKDRALNLLNSALGNDVFLKAKDTSALGIQRTKIFSLIQDILNDV